MTSRTSGSSSSRRKMDGTLIGEFRIGDEIGKGSFATVYRGTHRTSNAIVAVKSVNMSKLNKKLKENLYSEIDILKGLQHPHIVALIDCKETTTHIHLVMEFCELGDLSLFIKKRDTLGNHPATVEMSRKYPNPPVGGLNEVITRHFLKQLSSALEFLRVRNFIHRDVKPQNLLLNPSPKFLASHPDGPLIMSVNGNFETPNASIDSLPMLKIADFGFARSLPSTSLAETLCGSPLYMAPEILRYEKYDAKADLWSVGTVLYEMVIGKAPFRAGNHVELLRKIEQGDDQIKFSRDVDVSRGMKDLIRGLLKRNPVERMSFENFFGHDVVKEPIPGLAPEDQPQRAAEPRTIDRRSSTRDTRRAVSEQEARPTAHTVSSSSPRERAKRYSTPAENEDRERGERATVTRISSGTPPRQSAGRVHSASNPATTSNLGKRPIIQPSSTAPDMHVAQLADAMRTKGFNHGSPSPPSSLVRGPTTENTPTRREERLRRESEKEAADAVQFERDYVVVEKRAVEVNALADQLAADTRLSSPLKESSTSPRSGTMVRRATTQGQPASATGAVPPKASRAVAIAQGKARPEHHRQNSYERRYGPSPTTSAASVLSKAIAGASLRLFGFAPQKGSPPQFYSPYPQYPSATGISGLIADGRPTGPLDEDAKAVSIIEESATRSDVVYGFAEVKYKQLIPLAPSMDRGLGGVLGGGDGDMEEDEGLTPDAIVTLSEEALVLYVKALALLAKSFDIAGVWWAKKGTGEVIGTGNSPRNSSPAVVAASNRINQAVQWGRGRFNEVLEKAEFVRLKLIEAQKQLPEDHPAHPDNHVSASNLASASTGITGGIMLTPGVTAEKLMYDRAIEMSRSAAVNEIANTDLQGCEISYITAIRMLEAVLEDDEESLERKSSNTCKDERANRDDESNETGMSRADREDVQKILKTVRQRLLVLRQKMARIHKHQSLPSSLPANISRPSSQHSGGTTPTITSTPPK